MLDHALADIAARHGLRKSGNRFSGRCPQCGGGEESNRFVLFADGGFKCFACDWGGDRVRWLKEMDGLKCLEAHLQAGKACSPQCPHYDSCHRHGTVGPAGQRSLQPKRQHRPADKQVRVSEQLSPAGPWLDWAREHAAASHERLLARPEEMAWLARRGLDLAAVQRFGLGWQEHDSRVEWGLLGIAPARQDKEKCWLPGGLVIPARHMGGSIHRIRHRRTPEARQRFLPDLKYVQIKGSGTAPCTFGMDEYLRPLVLVVVESELDGMAVAAACPEVGVISLGTVMQPLTPALDAACRSARRILVALDADEKNSQGRRPGPEAAKIWRQQYRGAFFCPVPEGKDVGDYAALGGDLRAWIVEMAGIAPRPTIAPEPPPTHPGPLRPAELVVAADVALPPAGISEGGKGKGDDEFDELLLLLDTERGWIEISGSGIAQGGGLVARYQDRRGAVNARRGRVSLLINTNDAVLSELARLEPGRYGHRSLRQLRYGG